VADRLSRRQSALLPRPTAARPTATGSRNRSAGLSLVDLLAPLALIVPMAVVALRYAASSTHVYLSDDLALIDLHVRDALHWQQQLGPFDRFGWNHPGPAVFYLMSVGARILGSGARAEFVSAIVINLLAALATVWIVRRRCGPVAALWCASCLALLALVLASSAPAATTTSEGPLGALVSPWNPDVVIFPIVLFFVLAAAGACGSWLSLLGATLVGSYVIQTNLSTLVIVVVVMVAATAWAVVRAGYRARTRTGAHSAVPEGTGTRVGGTDRAKPVGRLLAAGGVVLLVLLWLPPLVQQVTNRNGNLTLIWRFFTAPHQAVSVSHSFWAVLAADSELVFGLAQEMSTRRLGDPHAREVLVLVLVLLVASACIVLGARRRQPLAVTLGIGTLIGFVFDVVSVTRIVGPVYGYLIVWMVAIPVAALIGLGAALFGSNETVPAVLGGPVGAVGVGTSVAPPVARLVRTSLMALTVAMGAILTVVTARIPPLERASDPTVARVVTLVSDHLRPGPRHVFVGDAGTNLTGLFTFFGLVDVLQERGYHPRVSPLWHTQVGPDYLSNGDEPVQVVLYPPSPKIRRMAGYVGAVPNADIVVAPGPPLP
jgi:hypothetical protein